MAAPPPLEVLFQQLAAQAGLAALGALALAAWSAPAAGPATLPIVAGHHLVIVLAMGSLEESPILVGQAGCKSVGFLLVAAPW
jgi:hypothetical protein